MTLAGTASQTAQTELAERLGKLSRPALWALAARLKTIGLSITPVLAGTILAAGEGGWRAGLTGAAIISAAFIQIGTNLWNDAADAERGIDTPERLGPPRMTALGLLNARDVRRGALFAFLLSASAGAFLADAGGWPIIAIGLVSLALGYLYSMGPYPLSGTPLGELLVIAFFGIVAVSGTAWLHGLQPDPGVLICGFLIGLPAAAVLLLNNHRDRTSDALGGRRTLAIVIGETSSRMVYSALILVSLAGVAFLARGCVTAILSLVPALVLAVALVRTMLRTAVSSAINRLIARTAGFQALLLLPLLVLAICR